jgi:hypothetical protein
MFFKAYCWLWLKNDMQFDFLLHTFEGYAVLLCCPGFFEVLFKTENYDFARLQTTIQ